MGIESKSHTMSIANYGDGYPSRHSSTTSRSPRTNVRLDLSFANRRSPLGLVPAEARLTSYNAFKRNRHTPSPSAFRRWEDDFWATAAADGRPRP